LTPQVAERTLVLGAKGGTMYRSIIREQVIYGHYREYYEIAEKMIAYTKAKGWAEWHVYSPLVGIGNEIVWHADYATLGELENEMNVATNDAGFMDLVRAQGVHIVQGSQVSELLVSLAGVA
jgi:hypothetical protein